MGLDITIDANTNKLTVTGGSPANAAEARLLLAINDNKVHVYLETTHNRVLPAQPNEQAGLIQMGAYSGSVSIGNGEYNATNYYIHDDMNKLEMVGGTSVGLSALHEINEAYIGAYLNPSQPYSPAAFNAAHAATEAIDPVLMPNIQFFDQTNNAQTVRLIGAKNQTTGDFVLFFYLQIGTGRIMNGPMRLNPK